MASGTGAANTHSIGAWREISMIQQTIKGSASRLEMTLSPSCSMFAPSPPCLKSRPKTAETKDQQNSCNSCQTSYSQHRGIQSTLLGVDGQWFTRHH